MIFERIRQVYPFLTKSHQRLADYLAASYREAAFLTASALADKLGMNEATVIRFAQRIGYRGYPEMMADIVQAVREELGLREGERAPHAAALMTYVQAEMERARWVLSHLPDDIPAVWQALRQARRIYVIGQGASAALAHLLAYALRSRGLSAENPPADALSLQMILPEVTAHCAAVAVALGPESGEVAHFLRRAREQGAWSLAFVASPISPCALAAEEVLLCGEEGRPSFGAAALLMEAIVQGMHREGTPWKPDEATLSRPLDEEYPPKKG